MNTYIISCNPLKFDIINHLSHDNEVLWKQTRSFQIGDHVYLYVGKPYSRLMFQFEIIEVNIPKIPEDNSYYSAYDEGRNKSKPFMKLLLLKNLPDEGLTLKCLLEHGLKTVQCTTKASQCLIAYIKSVVK